MTTKKWTTAGQVNKGQLFQLTANAQKTYRKIGNTTYSACKYIMAVSADDKTETGVLLVYGRMVLIDNPHALGH